MKGSINYATISAVLFLRLEYQHHTETFPQQVEDNFTLLEKQKAFLWWLGTRAGEHTPHHSFLCLDNSSNKIIWHGVQWHF